MRTDALTTKTHRQQVGGGRGEESFARAEATRLFGQAIDRALRVLVAMAINGTETISSPGANRSDLGTKAGRQAGLWVSGAGED